MVAGLVLLAVVLTLRARVRDAAMAPSPGTPTLEDLPVVTP